VRTLHLDVDSDLHAPRVLRHAVRAWLEAVDCTDDTKFDIVLLVSELASDAVREQATRVSAVMSFEHGRLRVDLDDDRPAQTTVGHRGPRRLAEQIADDWGRDSAPTGTHTWAEILC
jgi:anti-sigma regulatory factor (Ser/Thr protein kinase)